MWGGETKVVRTRLEQRELRLLQLDALASLVVILLVEFKADEVTLLADGCNGGGAAAHEWVEDGITFVTPTQDMV